MPSVEVAAEYPTPTYNPLPYVNPEIDTGDGIAILVQVLAIPELVAV
jgi:hypothetical protein